MMRPSLLLILTAALVEAGAQGTTTSIEVGAMGLRYADTISSGGIVVSPTLRYAGQRSSLTASATVSRFGSGVSGQGALGGSVFTPTRNAFSAELGAGVGGSIHGDGGRTGQTLASLRGHVMGERLGGWIGGGLGTIWDGASWRAIRQGDAGSWMTLSQGAALLLSVAPTAVDDTIRYVDAQTALALSLPRAQFDLSLGVRGGSRLPSMPGSPRVWGGVTFTAPMTPRAAAVIAAGTYPLDFTQGFPAGRYVSVSLRLSGRIRSKPTLQSEAPASGSSGKLTVERRSAGEVIISITAPSARTVEITGDFTQWEPRSMMSVADNRFTLTVPVTPGTYQMNVRINGGAWVVPSGMTVVRDELGNDVALLVIPDR